MRLSEVAKSAGLSQKEHEELVERKKRARRFAQVSGTLGLAALATRAPQGVKVATTHAPKLRDMPSVRRVVAAEPKATSASNTLTALGAGIGAAGSFNFAGMQRREAKAEEKAIRKGAASDAVKWVGRKLDDRAMRAARDLAPVGARLANGATVSGHEIRSRSFGLRSVRTTISRDGRGIGHVDTEMLPTKRLYVGGMGVDASERGKGVGTSALHMLEQNAPRSKNVRSVSWTAVGSKKASVGGDAMHGAYAWRHGDARYLPGVGIPRTMSAKEKLEALSPEQRRAARRYIRRSKVGLQRPGDLVSGSTPAGLDPKSAETLRGMTWWGGVKGGDRSHPVLGTTAAVGGVGMVQSSRRDRVAKARNDRVSFAWVLRNQDAMDDFTFEPRDFNLGSSMGSWGRNSSERKPEPKPEPKPAPKPVRVEPKPKPAPPLPPGWRQQVLEPKPLPAKPKGVLRRVPKKVAVPALSVAAVTGGAYGAKRAHDRRVGKAAYRAQDVGRLQRTGSRMQLSKSLPSELRRIKATQTPRPWRPHNRWNAYPSPRYKYDQFLDKENGSGSIQQQRWRAQYVANRLNATNADLPIAARRRARSASREALSRISGEELRKSDNRFLRDYRDRISPDAERGYNYLRDARSLRRTNAGLSAAVSGLSAASIAPAMALNSGKRRAVFTAGNAALAGVSGYSAVRDARAAHRLTGRMRKIEARAKQRERDGQWGVGRGYEVTDPSSRAKVRKAAPNMLSAVRQPVFRRRPLSYGVRSGGLVRLRDGRQVTRRGSVPGTGDFAR